MSRYARAWALRKSAIAATGTKGQTNQLKILILIQIESTNASLQFPHRRRCGIYEVAFAATSSC